jgi:hypothetical protein
MPPRWDGTGSIKCRDRKSSQQRQYNAWCESPDCSGGCDRSGVPVGRFARLRNLGNPCRLEAFPAVCIKPIVAEIASDTLHHFDHRCCLARVVLGLVEGGSEPEAL